MVDYIMWLLVGIFTYLAIGYIFVLSMEMYENGFWEQVSVMLLWPILVILFCICCIYFGCKEMYKKVKKYEQREL
jgi:preprotein translocase subunit SecG